MSMSVYYFLKVEKTSYSKYATGPILTSPSDSAHTMTGVHPRTKHLQTYGTPNQTRNLQIHPWLALIFFFFQSTTDRKKSCLRNQTAAMVPVHISAPWLIRVMDDATNRALDLTPGRAALWVLQRVIHLAGNKAQHVSYTLNERNTWYINNFTYLLTKRKK